MGGLGSEIGEVNLSYLLLAQRLLREDRATAMFRLGLSKELAELISDLSLSQVIKLAASSLLLCRFRFDDHAILSSLTHEGKDNSLQQAHAAILLASQEVEGIH
ncbi:flagellar transcriptional regulator FlhD [Glaciimonas sp. Gout2]|uniref:flagellar transcriptional regulator FlhD n=1 Tax=unclassified Glaciimonas TaxID=2644401 RepID=UPI002AB3D999|nr:MULTISPECIES: flagellar transcriptional regulator FlhD [unclassified Glaciimonas]MDY7548050.1 flagellar transcriptional regulator FlhD [Glaciimonas sp. CA11.2]MEB0010220.1 flagellar transcriptional regulator FlhD [Glaciimonas sp. Cout2]MEB0083719.1 flagellar transcriptional regulator FlhD [Glaciimonas sp. Gout2]